MSVHDVRTSISSPRIPLPRSGEDAPVARYPWRPTGRPRPRTEYWDVATAGWRSRGPLPED
jgi:hypothetical protein